MIEAVVIDVDDTLCLTEAACFDMENEVLVNMGRTPMSREIHRSTWGKPLFEAITDRSPGIDVGEFKAAYHPVIEGYVTTGKLDTIPDENYIAMDRLITLGKKIMLLTSRTHGELKHLLEPDHLLASRVEAFYYKDNMQFHKPDPRAFDELLQASSLAPGQCVYIGDSPSDAQAANQAGLHFVASLESGIRQKQDFDRFTVDAFVGKFPDIVGVVTALDHL